MASTASARGPTSHPAIDSRRSPRPYATALMNRRQPSETMRRKSIHYARKAVRLMKAGTLALAALEPARCASCSKPWQDRTANAISSSAGSAASWVGASNKNSSNATFATTSTARKGREADSRAITSLRSRNCARVGRSRKRAATRSRQCSCCSFHCGATKPPASRGTRSTCSCSASESQRTGRKPAKPTSCHCPRRRSTLLEARKPAAKGELVFPGADGKPYNGLANLLNRIRTRIGHADTKKAERFVFHDIRRAFVSHLAERGYDVDLLDQCLGHSRKGVFGIYQRASRMAERGRAMEAWAGLVTGAGEAGQVVAFPARQAG